jgi:hypothetical protein
MAHRAKRFDENAEKSSFNAMHSALCDIKLLKLDISNIRLMHFYQ